MTDVGQAQCLDQENEMLGPFPVVRLDAESGFERGLAYGRAARKQIQVSVDTYRELFWDFAAVDWNRAKELGEGSAKAIQQFDAELLEEIQGIAEGSGFERAEILALNARSEIALTSPLARGGCTAFAAFGRATLDGSTLLCQNWDWRASQRKAFVILHIRRPGKPLVTTLTEGGIVGKLGFNSEGLGACLNAIFTPEVNVDGTPLHVVLRGVLESKNLGDAVETVARSNMGSAGNFLLAQHGNGAIDIESAPSDFDILLPEQDVLAHTNHFFSPNLRAVQDLGKYRLPDTYPRLGRVKSLLAHRYGALDVSSAQEVLCDHANWPDSICRHEDEVGDPEGKRLQSVFSLVMDLGRRSYYVTDGPPCSDAFVAAHGFEEVLV